MLVRRLVSGVRNSWHASATSWRCRRADSSSAPSIALNGRPSRADLVGAADVDPRCPGRASRRRARRVASAGPPGAERPGPRPTRRRPAATPAPEPTSSTRPSRRSERRARRATARPGRRAAAAGQRDDADVLAAAGVGEVRPVPVGHRPTSGCAATGSGRLAADRAVLARPAEPVAAPRRADQRRSVAGAASVRLLDQVGPRSTSGGVDLARASTVAHVDVDEHRHAEHDGHGDGGRAASRASRRRRLTDLAQHVADAAHRLDQARLAAGLGLAPQVADVDLERVGRGAEVVAPDPLEDQLAGQHLARVAQEAARAGRTRCGSARSRAAAADLVGDRVERQVGEAQRLGCAPAAVRRSSARSRASSSSSANGLTR